MGKQVEDGDAFGSRYLDIFRVGDLVSWAHLGNTKEYGYIIKIYNEKMRANRCFVFARIRKTDGSTENFMLSEIQKES
tara:strand:+ start:111 stop:344 length:234 start_codon:yes stop_codon:yes gene_type:complete